MKLVCSLVDNGFFLAENLAVMVFGRNGGDGLHTVNTGPEKHSANMYTLCTLRTAHSLAQNTLASRLT